jgi:hypothetical protein
MSSLQFAGKFENEVPYEIHTVATFSGRNELAILVAGKPAAIISVVKKRNGTIEINPIMTQKTIIPGENKEVEQKEVEVNRKKLLEE